jgi:hypothetical protein
MQYIWIIRNAKEIIIFQLEMLLFLLHLASQKNTKSAMHN